MSVESDDEVKKIINEFLKGNKKNKGREPNERYTSFDYCYNYFYSFYKEDKLKELANEKNLQMSCLQLGFYLASWGMMRPSSFTLQKSVKNYAELIIKIPEMNRKLWEIDVNQYYDDNIALLLECKQIIIEKLGKNINKPSDALVTKIMLGIFANIPAFDKYFKIGLRVNSVNKKNLQEVAEVYKKNDAAFDSFKIKTYDFLSAKETEIIYSKAKLVDMYGFTKGLNQASKNKN